MSVKTKSQEILSEAKELAGKVDSWADFSNHLFDQRSGLVAKTFHKDIERQAFYDSDEYQQINKILADLMRQFGVVGGSLPKEKSGKFVVRVAKTLHQKLEMEAKREGVSLNQLAATKLSVPLSEGIEISDNLLVDAFNKVHDGYSTDYVLIHPELNSAFLEACADAGIGKDTFALNKRLLNIRKTKSKSSNLNRASKRSKFRDYDKFEFASEIAVRTLQRTKGLSLDTILCDVDVRADFDQIARELVAGFDSLHFRAAALNLRKGHRLQPIADDVEKYDLVSEGPIKNINLNSLSDLPGMYALYDQNRPVFAGETQNLRERIARHLSGGIPSWAWDEETFNLRMLVMPSGKQDARRQWLMRFVNAERPLLNYQKAA